MKSCSVSVLCILGMTVFVCRCLLEDIMLVGNTIVVVHHFSLVPNLETWEPSLKLGKPESLDDDPKSGGGLGGGP